MIRNLFILLGTFIVGALAALAIRAAAFNPHEGHEGHPETKEYAQMVTNKLSSPVETQPASVAATAPTHSEHAMSEATVAAADKPVNTVCAICGMPVDPKIPMAEYKGQKIGFGCRMCPPKFKANPDYYGPFYLRNEIIRK